MIMFFIDKVSNYVVILCFVFSLKKTPINTPKMHLSHTFVSKQLTFNFYCNFHMPVCYVFSEKLNIQLLCHLPLMFLHYHEVFYSHFL